MSSKDLEKLIEALVARERSMDSYSVQELQYLLFKMYGDYSAIVLTCFRRRDEFEPAARDMVDKAYLGLVRFANAISKGTEQEEEADRNLEAAEQMLAEMQAYERGKQPVYYAFDTVFEE